MCAVVGKKSHGLLGVVDGAVDQGVLMFEAVLSKEKVGMLMTVAVLMKSYMGLGTVFVIGEEEVEEC